MSETKDQRIEDRRRRFVVEVTDHVNLPMDPEDLEWIGERLEMALRGRFDMTVEDVQIETFSSYKGEFVPGMPQVPR